MTTCCCYCLAKKSVQPVDADVGILYSNFISTDQQGGESTSNNKRSCHYLTTSFGTDNSNKPGLLLFFVHGVGSSSAIWIPYINYLMATPFPLKEQYNVRLIAPDLFGHGRSSSSSRNRSDYIFTKLCQDLLAIFDKEVASCKAAILIGHSYGCSISSFIAAERLSKVTGLCLISPSSPLPLQPKDSILKLPSAFICCIFPCLRMAFRRQAYSSPLCCAKAASEKIAFNIQPHVFQSVMLGQVWPAGDANFYASLSSKVPRCLVMHGANDRLVPISEGEWTSQTIGAHFVVIENAGHMAPSETVDIIKEQLLSFLNNMPI